MRIYPKGCRWYWIADSKVAGPFKMVTRTTIDSWRWDSEDTYIIQPRGKKKWWFFKSKRFVAASLEPDTLIARALLEVD